MKKLLTFFTVTILAGSIHANAQTKPAKSTPQPAPAAKVEKGTVLLKESNTTVKEAESDIKIIDGRNVRVDSQGIQSLEVVSPTPASKPKTENSVK